MEKGNNQKFTFGLEMEHCFEDTFDTVEELIAFAKDAYEHPDGNYWDEDSYYYPDSIFIGIVEHIKASDYAPSLDDIADQMTDSIYSQHNFASDEDVHVCKKEEAEVEWQAFIEKFFELPFTMAATWIGRYDLKEDRWIENLG